MLLILGNAVLKIPSRVTNGRAVAGAGAGNKVGVGRYYLLGSSVVLFNRRCSNSTSSPPIIAPHIIAVSLNMIRGPLRAKHRLAVFPPPTQRCGQRRYRSYLAPPFLLDDYIPRYHLLSSVDAAKKRSKAYTHLKNCNLCPRLCGVNRYETTGHCLIGGSHVTVNTIAPHFGEGAVSLKQLLIRG